MKKTKTPLDDERAAFEAALSFAESEGLLQPASPRYKGRSHPEWGASPKMKPFATLIPFFV